VKLARELLINPDEVRTAMGGVLPEKMSAVLLLGHGGLDQLQFRTDVPVPRPGAGEVLIRCRATSINNTDVNTRTAWYSKSVTGATNAGDPTAAESAGGADGGWTGEPIHFPRIQGADCYGEIVDVGHGVAPERVGERVLVRTMLRAPVDFRPYECWTFGSECDGGFAQFVVAPDADVYRVDSDLTDAELGAIPCAYSTAEGMLVRAGVGAGDRILVTGASGGVGSAAVQLAKLRGAEVIALASGSKAEAVGALGADRVIRRGDDLSETLGAESLSVIVDLVAGEDWKSFLPLLRRGGRYVTAGAIAGPIVEMDVRSLYLKDLTLYGCAFQEDAVFENIVRYLAERRLKPAIAATFPLEQIVAAQQQFLEKSQVGKIVLVP
jgi:NADPH:quinone reductase-like Zn-dependent oxidoreductase